jgi:F-type H+-transporting ATPase subunit a
MISFFAASEGVPLAAEPVFHIGSFAVTNSMLLGVVSALTIIIFFLIARFRTKLRPVSGFAFVIEQIVDFILNIAEQNFGDRKKALKHLPVLLTLFVFILFCNLSGLIPGVGSVTITTDEGPIPLLRAFTTDLNGTLALAILSIGMVQFYAVKELGVIGRLQHFFTNKPYNPMNFFLGLVEVLSEFIRILTLSMRLFGVIYAGEVLIHVIGSVAGNLGWAATLPIYMLEVFFSLIQAYIFVMLTTVYLATATEHAEDHQDLSEAEHSPVIAPDTRRVPAGSDK